MADSPPVVNPPSISTNKIMITVETQTYENDFCLCFVPEYDCKNDEDATIDPHIAIKLNALNSEEKVVVRNFEANSKWQPKKRWKFAGNAIKAMNRFGKSRNKNKPFYKLSLRENDQNLMEPQQSGLYVRTVSGERVESENTTTTKKRFSLTGLINDMRQNKGDKSNRDSLDSQRPRKSSYLSGCDSGRASIREKNKKYSSFYKLENWDESKPFVLDHKSKSMYDMKTLQASVDSFDRFCGSPDMRQSTPHIREINEKPVKVQKRNKKLKRSNSWSVKKERSDSGSDKQSPGQTYHNKNIDMINNSIIETVTNHNKRNGRPQSYLWDPRQIVSEMYENEYMNRKGKRVIGRAYSVRERRCKSSFDIPDDEEFTDERLIRERFFREILLAKELQDETDLIEEKIRRELIFNELLAEKRRSYTKASKNFDKKKLSASYSKAESRKSVGREDIRQVFNNEQTITREIPQSYKVQINKSITKTSKLEKGILKEPKIEIKKASEPKKEETKDIDNKDTLDFTAFAIVPGTPLQRKLSQRGINGKAPINVIEPTKSPLSDGGTPMLAKRKSFHSADDIVGTICDFVPIINTSLSADDVTNEEVMANISARKEAVSQKNSTESKSEDDVPLLDDSYYDDDDDLATYV